MRRRTVRRDPRLKLHPLVSVSTARLQTVRCTIDGSTHNFRRRPGKRIEPLVFFRCTGTQIRLD